jgi:hypothetical protein
MDSIDSELKALCGEKRQLDIEKYVTAVFLCFLPVDILDFSAPHKLLQPKSPGYT